MCTLSLRTPCVRHSRALEMGTPTVTLRSGSLALLRPETSAHAGAVVVNLRIAANSNSAHARRNIRHPLQAAAAIGARVKLNAITNLNGASLRTTNSCTP